MGTRAHPAASAQRPLTLDDIHAINGGAQGLGVVHDGACLVAQALQGQARRQQARVAAHCRQAGAVVRELRQEGEDGLQQLQALAVQRRAMQRRCSAPAALALCSGQQHRQLHLLAHALHLTGQGRWHLLPRLVVLQHARHEDGHHKDCRLAEAIHNVRGEQLQAQHVPQQQAKEQAEKHLGEGLDEQRPARLHEGSQASEGGDALQEGRHAALGARKAAALGHVVRGLCWWCSADF